MRARAAMVCAAFAVGCGTLGAPSTGDVDLPAGFVGPFSALGPGQQPSNSRVLLSASDPMQGLESPSVLVLDGVHFVYTTLLRHPMPPAIALATERDGLAGSLLFDAPVVLMTAMQPWEGDGVSDPGVASDGTGGVLMVYAAGGSIGLARSRDGRTFTRNASPVLTPDATRGETALGAPTLARAPSGGAWWIAYSANDAIFAAHADSPDGPWTRVGHPIATPATGVPEDAGTAFESHALTDPTLSIQPTAAGRTLFVLFYTAVGPTALDVIGVGASFDGETYTQLARPVYSERTTAVHPGSFEPLGDRTALLWFTTMGATQRVVSAAIGPGIDRVSASQPH